MSWLLPEISISFLPALLHWCKPPIHHLCRRPKLSAPYHRQNRGLTLRPELHDRLFGTLDICPSLPWPFSLHSTSPWTQFLSDQQEQHSFVSSVFSDWWPFMWKGSWGHGALCTARITACAPADVEEYYFPSKVTRSIIFSWLSIVMKCQCFATLTLFCNVPKGTQLLLKHWLGLASPTDLHHLSFWKNLSHPCEIGETSQDGRWKQEVLKVYLEGSHYWNYLRTAFS